MRVGLPFMSLSNKMIDEYRRLIVEVKLGVISHGVGGEVLLLVALGGGASFGGEIDFHEVVDHLLGVLGFLLVHGSHVFHLIALLHLLGDYGFELVFLGGFG